MKQLQTKFLFFTLFLNMLFSSHLFAQEKGNAYYGNANYGNNRANQFSLQAPEFENDSTIVVGANILMNVKPSSYIIIIGLSQVGANTEICNQLLNQRIDGLTEKLVNLGINKNDIKKDFISQIPVYEYETEKKLFSKTYQEVPAGFYLNKNLHIAYKSADTFEQILAEAAKFDIYDIVKVEYIIDNTSAIYDSLRSEAIGLINRKVQDFKKLGLTFNNRFHIVAENYASISPADRYKKYNAFSTPSLQNLKRNATVNQANRQETYFYEKVPYQDFDIVINPLVVEPVPQFTYSIKVRYVLKRL
jgi:uncharacterized protein YggE